YLLSYGLFLFIIVAKLMGRRPLPLEGKRSDGRARLREGEIVNMEVGLTATRRLSTFILEERIPEGLGESAQLPLASLEPSPEVQTVADRHGVLRHARVHAGRRHPASRVAGVCPYGPAPRPRGRAGHHRQDHDRARHEPRLSLRGRGVGVVRVGGEGVRIA